jgi:ankyrin repeat protein
VIFHGGGPSSVGPFGSAGDTADRPTKANDSDLKLLSGLRHLRILAIRGSKITDSGLAELAGHVGLRQLELDDAPITDDGLVHLGNLSHLQHLSLTGTLVCGPGLARLRSLKTLGHLSLDSTGLTDAGLAYLSGLEQLRTLSLEDTDVTDAGLAALKTLKHLECLVLSGTRITNAGLVHLEGLAELRTMDCSKTKVDREGVKRLRRALPKLGWVDYQGANDDPWFDTAKAKANNRILERVIAGDLAGFQAVVAQNPAAVNLEWYGGFVKNPGPNADMTALQLAARNGDLPMVRFLVEHGADLNAQAGVVHTPLIIAAEKGNLPVVKLLLEHGAAVKTPDLFSLDVWDDSPLSHAATQEIAAALVAKGAKVNWPDTVSSPLAAAVGYNRAGIVKLLLQAGARVPKYEEPSWTLLHLAASHGCGEEIIEMLLQAGVPVDARTQKIEPPSVVEDRNDWARNRTPPGIGRRTPLHVAIQAGNLAAATTLVAHGADIHARTVDRQTPLSLARWVEGYRDIAGLYQSSSAGLSRRTDQNRRQAVDNRNAARKTIAELLRSGEK